jgi:hypothetical protein
VSTAAALLDRLMQLGVSARADGGMLRLRPRATLFRWVEAVIASGKVGASLARKVRKAVATKAAPAEAAAAVVELLPAPLAFEEAVKAGSIPIIQELMTCVAAAKQVMAYARKEDGSVRNARLLLTAAEQLRRTTDSCVRLQEAMTDLQRLEQFNTIILEEIDKESPACAQRIGQRMSALLEVRLAGQG